MRKKRNTSNPNFAKEVSYIKKKKKRKQKIRNIHEKKQTFKSSEKRDLKISKK